MKKYLLLILLPILVSCSEAETTCYTVIEKHKIPDKYGKLKFTIVVKKDDNYFTKQIDVTSFYKTSVNSTLCLKETTDVVEVILSLLVIIVLSIFAFTFAMIIVEILN